MKRVMEGQGKADLSPHNTRLPSDTGSDSACFLCRRQEKTFKWGRGGVEGRKITSSIHSTSLVNEFFSCTLITLFCVKGKNLLGGLTPDLKGEENMFLIWLIY